MAKSPAHKIGQLIGHMLEEIFEPLLREVSTKTDTYLDKTNIDRPSRTSKTLMHIDDQGNNHGLDFVYERFGDDNNEGLPIGFIECAWRRYTKHSKNKVQEIHSAIESLAMKHKSYSPFKGAILSGHYSEPSLQQLKSQGYTIIHIPYETVIEAYEYAGFDIAYDSETVLEDLLYKGISIDGLSETDINKIRSYIFKACHIGIYDFIHTLIGSLTKQIELINITPVIEQSYNFTEPLETLKWLTSSNNIHNRSINLIDLEITYSNKSKTRYERIETDSAKERIAFHQRLSEFKIEDRKVLIKSLDNLKQDTQIKINRSGKKVGQLSFSL
ncbi:hypothetical protein [Pseudoalteromonas marina]|uniref:Uncharacterized protein n=1 Tax=Pseudoalteromonas marina TaxID=267375 RepID=A0ABT9FC93_9GAMM|nr:hypothetical protein [Pseudoalteromonas marina]MDP2564407.1 hypothetical protein [Pseudoalteromonas marina]